MATVVSEVMDRLPTPDGGFRRRFTAGIIFVMILTFGIFVKPGYPTLTSFIIASSATYKIGWNVFNNTTFAIITFSIVFSIGTLIEIFSYVFLGKLFSLVGGTFAYRGLARSIKALGKRSDQNTSPTIEFSTTEEAETYTTLPDYVKDGIANPYGRKFEVAFRYLLSIAPDEERSWLVRLDARNQNLFSMMSAVLLAVSILAAVSFVEVDGRLDRERERNTSWIDTQQKLESCVKNAQYGLANLGVDQLENYEVLFSKRDAAAYFSSQRSQNLQNDKIVILLKRIEDELLLCKSNAGITDDIVDRSLNIESAQEFALDVAGFFVVVGGFLLVMSIVYSFMLRDSISSALEMLSLKKGIVTDDTVADSGGKDQPSPESKSEIPA